MTNQRKQNTALILNIILVILEITGIIMALTIHGVSNLTKYTTDSNIIALCSSILFVISALTKKLNRKMIFAIRFMAATSLMVTFLVVLGGCITGIGTESVLDSYIYDSSLFLHFLCPVISFISFMFFEDSIKIKLSSCFIACIPTFAYALISTPLNILRIWHGPYPFLYVYEQPVYMSVLWFFIINGGAFLLAVIILFIRNKINTQD